jgi:hypothetical protein
MLRVGGRKLEWSQKQMASGCLLRWRSNFLAKEVKVSDGGVA